MKVIFFSLILFVSLFIGLFGFSQIVGSIKYYENKISVLTIGIWLIILSLIFLAVFAWLNTYLKAIIIGYIIGFALSLSVKPD